MDKNIKDLISIILRLIWVIIRTVVMIIGSAIISFKIVEYYGFSGYEYWLLWLFSFFFINSIVGYFSNLRAVVEGAEVRTNEIFEELDKEEEETNNCSCDGCDKEEPLIEPDEEIIKE